MGPLLNIVAWCCPERAFWSACYLCFCLQAGVLLGQASSSTSPQARECHFPVTFCSLAHGLGQPRVARGLPGRRPLLPPRHRLCLPRKRTCTKAPGVWRTQERHQFASTICVNARTNCLLLATREPQSTHAIHTLNTSMRRAHGGADSGSLRLDDLHRARLVPKQCARGPGVQPHKSADIFKEHRVHCFSMFQHVSARVPIAVSVPAGAGVSCAGSTPPITAKRTGKGRRPEHPGEFKREMSCGKVTDKVRNKHHCNVFLWTHRARSFAPDDTSSELQVAPARTPSWLEWECSAAVVGASPATAPANSSRSSSKSE